MSEVSFTVSIPLDDDGYLDRECPSPQCGRVFKVRHDDWEASTALGVYCPFCRLEAEPGDFISSEQQEYLQRELEAKSAELIQGMLGGFARQVNRQNRSRSPLSIKVSTKFADVAVPIPPSALAPMTLRVECDACGSHYAVMGAGFFCPLCGRNSARQTFHQSVAKSRTAVSLAHQLVGALGDPDAAAEGARTLLESQMGDLVTAFQRFAGVLYPLLPTTPDRGKDRNLFQRLADASKKWKVNGGRGFDAILSADEWSSLKRYFQQRHLLQHTEGIVDEDYVEKSGDRSYQVGQRLSITPAQIEHMAVLVEKLGTGLESDIKEGAGASGRWPSDPATSRPPKRLPGTTEEDWLVYQTICAIAMDEGVDSISGHTIHQRLNDQSLSDQELSDALEILESKGLIKLSRYLGSGPVPAHITMTQRGLEIFFSQTMPDVGEAQRQIAAVLLDGAGSSDLIIERTGLSKVFVEHTLRTFESKRWIGKLFWSGGIALISINTEVHLKRFVHGQSR